MVITPNQLFFALLLIAAIIGYARGWHREIITTAVILGCVLFLTIGGGNVLAELIAAIPSFVRGNSPSINFSNPTPNPTVDVITLIGFVVLGHLAGTRFGTAPKSAQHRLSGMLAGIVSGLAIIYYITRELLPVTTFSATSPSSALVTVWLIGLFGAGLVLLLFIAIVRK